jgi:hypothetical protein
MSNSQNKDLATSLEVVSGNPTPQELAAVVAVLREATGTTQSTSVESNWARGSRLLRDSNNTGEGEWRSDFKGEI